jgi:hypothetical protein
MVGAYIFDVVSEDTGRGRASVLREEVTLQGNKDNAATLLNK